MVNLEFQLENGESYLVYDVHPSSQEFPVELPQGAKSVTVWLGLEDAPVVFQIAKAS